MRNISGSGQILKNAREQAGISIENMSEQMKVSEKILRALEEEQLNILPASTYVYGYIKSYCRILDLFSDEIIKNYPSLTSSLENQAAVNENLFSKKKNKGASPFLAYSIFVFVIISILGGLAYWSYFQLGATGKPIKDEKAETTNIVEQQDTLDLSTPIWQASEIENTAEEERLAADVLANSVEEENIPASIKELGSLKFVFKGECWVEVLDADGNKLLYFMGKKDQTRKVQGKYPFEVTIGFLPNVDIYLDNKKLDFKGMTNSVFFKTIINR